MKNLITLFSSLLIIGCKLDSLTIHNIASENRIDQLFEHIDANSPGYMVGVIKDSEYIFQKGYGIANLEHEIPITQQSAFNIASLSKQFTGACLALLILEKKVSLEDNVRAYFPDFPKYSEEIKIKHLVYMTSGINDYYYNERKNGTDWSSLNYFSIDTAIDASLSNSELMYSPGTKWSYSNINYILLTKIIEKVSGIKFSTFAKKRLFEPLKMNNTCVNDDVFEVIPNRVNAYNHRDEENTQGLIESGYLREKGEGFLQINRNSPHYGGSGVYSSMDDLKKWVDNFDSKDFGGDAFYDLMHKTMKFDHEKSNDAFGLVIGEFKGHEMVWYEGGDWGFSSYMMRFQKDNLTIICLSNLGTGNSRSFAHKIMDILINDKIIELK